MRVTFLPIIEFQQLRREANNYRTKMIKTIGHHTIEKTGEAVAERLSVGPVFSTVLDRAGNSKPKPPFAGDGYYFWEDNIEAADWWGLVHYRRRGKDYRVFKIDLELSYETGVFLDLIGNRQHIEFMAELIRKTKQNIPCTDWKFHQFIAYFRKTAERNPRLFPYKMMRFNDAKLNPKIQEPLTLTESESSSKFLLLNPFYIVCVFELSELNLATFAFVK